MTAVLAPTTTLPEAFRPLRVQEHHQLIQLGVFEGTHVELVGGVLVEMSPHGPEHFGLIPYLNHLDFAILTKRDTRRTGKPTDALLVIEVSNSSVRFDLGDKARRYAGAGYPEYWVIDVAALLDF
ncbi:MAG: Uma2 family endonuclease [Euzebya sp.]